MLYCSETQISYVINSMTVPESISDKYNDLLDTLKVESASFLKWALFFQSFTFSFSSLFFFWIKFSLPK